MALAIPGSCTPADFESGMIAHLLIGQCTGSDTCRHIRLEFGDRRFSLSEGERRRSIDSVLQDCPAGLKTTPSKRP